jgi:hypothetical protein
MTIPAVMEAKRYTGVSAHPRELKYTCLTEEGSGAAAGLAGKSMVLTDVLEIQLGSPWDCLAIESF